MKRRLFVGQLVAGLGTAVGTASGVIPLSATASPAGPAKEVATWVEEGLVGEPQRLILLLTYSPQRTPSAHQLLHRELVRASQLLGRLAALREQELNLDVTPDEFGSFITQTTKAGVLISGQASARLDQLARAPEITVLLYGSQATLQYVTNRNGYQLIDHGGKVVRNLLAEPA